MKCLTCKKELESNQKEFCCIECARKFIAINSEQFFHLVYERDKPEFPLVLITGQLPSIMSEERTMYPCTCADCGKDSKVPFQPKEGRPVYCQECLPKHRSRRF